MSMNLAPNRPTPRGLLKGKNVLITAAAGTGIGYATAERMAEEGARVFISDMHERRLGEAGGVSAAHLPPDLAESRVDGSGLYQGAHHVAIVVVVLQVAKVCFAQRSERFVGEPVRRWPARREQLLVDVGHEMLEDTFLVLEVPVQRTHRKAGLNRDIGHTSVDIAVPGEHSAGRLEQLLPRSATFGSRGNCSHGTKCSAGRRESDALIIKKVTSLS